MESNELQGLFEALPCVAMVFSKDGKLRYCNDAAQEVMGQVQKVRNTLTDVFTVQSAELIERYLNLGTTENEDLQELLEIKSSYQFPLEMAFQLRWWVRPETEPLLILTANKPKVVSSEHARLEEDYRTLRSIIETLNIPTWCIEYSEPVDLSGSDKEIIRQVFENDSRWYMCNKAMARLYDIPDDLDFNKHPVRINFPRSPQNEAFIQELIDNDYFVDDALSIDTSHDGSLMYISNTVRTHIEHGLMRRMWGTCRDITRDRRMEAQMKQRENEMRGVLSSVPEVIVVVDGQSVLQGANPAFEHQLGWRIDDWLGKELTQVVNLKPYTMRNKEMRSGAAQRFIVPVSCADKKTRNFDTSLAYFDDDINSNWFVGVLRQVEG